MRSPQRSFIHRAVLIMAALTFVAVAALQMAQADGGAPVYRVLPIPTPAGWQNVVPRDINRSGQIVGSGFNGTTNQPFIADVRTFAPIALPPGFLDGYGIAINASGQIAGFGVYFLPSGIGGPPDVPNNEAFTGGIGGITSVFRLPDSMLGEIGTYAFDINDSGSIAGTQSFRGLNCNNGLFRSLFGNPSVPRGINSPPAAGIDEFAFGINNLGQIVSISHDPILPPPQTFQCVTAGAPRLLLRDALGITSIPVPTGWYSANSNSCYRQAGQVGATSNCDPSSKLQINDSEQIAAMVTNGQGGLRVALSTRTSTFLLPLPSGVVSVSRPSLNNLGQVVGEINDGPGGWIWDASHGSRLLQDLVPSGWTILSADGINDNGQIVARASNSTGFSGPVILDPTVNVNSLVSFTPMTATYRTQSDTTGCPAGFAGKFTFTASLTNKATSPALQGLAVRVQTLSNGNVLLDPQTNALIGGQGAIMPVPKQGMNTDDVLSPSEAVGVPFVLCLKTMQSFQFLVDVFGIPDVAP